MKEIYVYKLMFGGWKGISNEEAEAKIKEGRVYGAELEMDRGDAEPLKITLLKDSFSMFGATDEMMNQLITDYITYVEEITGMVTKPNT